MNLASGLLDALAVSACSLFVFFSFFSFPFSQAKPVPLTLDMARTKGPFGSQLQSND